MKVLFRTDASLKIGNGHVMRCLTLARHLSAQGVGVSFACRNHPGNLSEFLTDSGFRVHILPVTEHLDAEGPSHVYWLGGHWQDDASELAPLIGKGEVNWIVVDHYGLDRRFELAMVAAGANVMVIDDLADRPHACRLLVDQTYGRASRDYAGLVPQDALVLCGADNALLRPEFAAVAADSIKRRRQLSPMRKMLVAMGGVDEDNVTGIVLDTLDTMQLEAAWEITVVLGANAPWYDQIVRRSAQMSRKIYVYRGIANMASVMSEMDLAIGAAGSTAWERCCLGLPSLMVVIADNQQAIADNLAAAGAAVSLGSHKCPNFKGRLADEISAILESTDRRLDLINTAALVTDGLGVNRVAGAMLELSRS